MEAPTFYVYKGKVGYNYGMYGGKDVWAKDSLQSVKLCDTLYHREATMVVSNWL